MAIGVSGEIYVASFFGSAILVYNANGVKEYDLYVPSRTVWDMFTDSQRNLYVTTYSKGTVLVYSPQYLIDQAAARPATDSHEQGFRVRPVTVIKLDS